jgi:hypothetical protein
MSHIPSVRLAAAPKAGLMARALSDAPRRLAAWGVLATVLTLAQLVFTLGSVSNLRATVQTIGRDATPSVAAAEQIVAKLSDMDASAANAALVTGAAEAWKQFDADRLAVNKQLVDAARNITYGDAEYKPILTMASELQSYLVMIEHARSSEGEARAAQLQAASTMMRQKAQPAAEALDVANFTALDRAYANFQESVWGRIAGLAAAAVLLTVVLVLSQLYLARTTHRVINPPLLMAAVAVSLTAFIVCSATIMVAADVKTAKADAFDSIHALSKARAAANLANADESLWLLSGAPGKALYERSFRANAARIAAEGAGTPVSQNMYRMIDDHGRGFTGFLAVELSNITFAGERTTAEEMARFWGHYVTIDQKIRTLETTGHHAEAIAMCLGMGANESNHVFSQFDKALGAMLSINQKAFDAAVTHAFSLLEPLPWGLFASAAITVALIWWGLGLRLREYW